jgi:alginate O-acetyltransferase complex protein AlgI
MVVNSISFLLFFVVVFIVYYLLKGKDGKRQNLWLLVASYFFYGYTEWRMLPLLIFTTLFFYGLGIAIGYYNEKDEKKASFLTTFSVLGGISILLYFKYLNFFVESFSNFFNAVGLHTNGYAFSIIMPLGISFFTFKLISYVIEVHRRHIEPCRNLVAFATYIGFFPTILSGPIDRPKQFLGQLSHSRTFDYAMVVDGSRQILWGMFKKMVIADNLAMITSGAWGNYESLPGNLLFANALLYTFQMYTDFSGYSDMAIGVGKLLGIKVAKNFNYPFFAHNVAEYWRRWHMSLTSWLTDYVFMPLNIRFRDWGLKGILLAVIINLMAVGMWHGANYTFALFGLYHGLLFIPLVMNGSFMKKRKEIVGKYGLPRLQDLGKMLGTYLLVTLGLIIFAAPSVTVAGDYVWRMITEMATVPNHGIIGQFIISEKTLLVPVLTSLALIVIEWKNRKREYGLCLVTDVSNKYVRYLIYQAIILAILFFQGVTATFMYFQF